MNNPGSTIETSERRGTSSRVMAGARRPVAMFALLGACAMAMVATAAGAAPSPDPPPASDEGQAAAGSAAEEQKAAEDQKAEALQLLREGNELVKEGDFGEALKKFQAAYGLYPSVKLLLNIGTSLRHVGRVAEAVDTYEQYLEHPEADPARVGEVGGLIAELERKIGRLIIEIEPAYAVLRVDGRRIGLEAGKVRLRVDPGEHTLIVEHPSYTATVRTVSVGMREEQDLRIELISPEAGSEARVVPADEEVDGTAHTVAGIVITALGVAGAGAGVVFGVLALSTDADADGHCTATDPSVCDAEGEELGQTASMQGTLSTAFLIGGGALFATGLIVWLTAPSSDDGDGTDESSSTVGLRLGSEPGVSLVGRW